jgi:hypothetical protein
MEVVNRTTALIMFSMLNQPVLRAMVLVFVIGGVNSYP